MHDDAIHEYVDGEMRLTHLLPTSDVCVWLFF